MTPSKSEKQGDAVEYLVAQVFQSQGCLVRRSVPLQYGPSGTDATDIDVLGIKFTQPFQTHRIICDCKDRQRSRPYERIFWAKGLASFVHASETYVCLPRANIEIVNFARSGQVRVLPQEGLQSAAPKAMPYSAASPLVAERLRAALGSLKADRTAAVALDQIRRLYLGDDPYVGLNVAVLALTTAARSMRQLSLATNGLHDVWRFIAGECLVLIPLFLVNIAGDTFGLAKDHRQRHITERLTYGDLPPRKAEELFDLAKQVAAEASKAANPALPISSPLPFDLGRIEPPPYADAVVGLVERAVMQPDLYLGLPQIMDYLVFEQSIQGGTFNEQSYRSVFPGSLQDEKLKVARNIFVFGRDQAKLDLSVFWPRQEGNLPKARQPQTDGSPQEAVAGKSGETANTSRE